MLSIQTQFQIIVLSLLFTPVRGKLVSLHHYAPVTATWITTACSLILFLYLGNIG